MATRKASAALRAASPRKSGAPLTGGGNTPPADTAMAAVGELICRLNPYTNLPKDDKTGQKTGKMEVATTLPPPSVAAARASSTTPRTADVNALAIEAAIAGIAIEVERNYGTTWNFKGQPQSVKAAYKIAYRFPVMDAGGKILYWQTESLLIGYAGGEGPG